MEPPPPHPSQVVNGVVIISLPPVDNPSKGKTITSIFSISEPSPPNNNPSPLTPQEQFYNHNLPLQSQPHYPHYRNFLSFKSFFNTPRKILSLVCVSVLGILLWNSVFSGDTLYELKYEERNGNQDEINSFVFPLHSKLSGKIGDLEMKLRKVVKRDGVMLVNDGVEGKGISSKMGASVVVADSSTVFPVMGNVYPYGLYYVTVLVGNPPRPYHLDMDTGSDLTWIQCDAPCTSCAKGPHPLYKPSTETLVSSNDFLCKEVQSNQKHEYRDSHEQCDYEIEYADRSSSMGVLARDGLQLMIANGTISKESFVFGCAYDQQGHLSESPAKTDGVVGLGGAKVSLPSQLAERGVIRNVIGHCISRSEENHGYMFLGDDFVPKWGMTWIPMPNTNSFSSKYHSEIVKLTYGGSELLRLSGHENGVAQVVFDSGSSYTYLTKQAYTDLVASLEESFSGGLIQDKSDPTLPLCWRAEFPVRSLTDVRRFFRPLTFHFGSKWWIMSRKISIAPEGYLIISDKGNVCLGILDGNDIHDGSTIILGDVSLRGQLVAYDNVNKRIGWMKSDCVMPQRYNSLPFFF
ncbi:hypothetical protein ACHQM5_005720 [Ranunculus cassubicifolius]